MSLDPEKLRAYTDRQIRRFEKSKKDFLTKHYPAIEADFLRVVPVDKFPDHTFECFGTFHKLLDGTNLSMTDDAESQDVIQSACRFAMHDWIARGQSIPPDLEFKYLIRFSDYVNWIEFSDESREVNLYCSYQLVSRLNASTTTDKILDTVQGSKMISDMLLYPEKWSI